jgi:exodeoxyribonuclease VII large subunit
VVHRRNPSLEILVAACQVQGQGAARDIANAINDLNAWSKRQSPGTGLDLILVTRGGGSLEDLWAFNEEPVARAIHASALPVISAIGHEIDFTISDFVADLRAATPSAAAELITEGVFSSAKFITQAADWMRQHTLREIGRRLENLQDFRQRLRRCHPRRRFQDQSLLLDEAETRLLRATRSALRAKSLLSQNAIDRLVRTNPAEVIIALRDRVQSARAQIARQTLQTLARAKLRADSAEAKLELLAPERVLARGYSITMDDETGTVVRDASSVKPGQVLRTKLSRGEIRSRGV